LRLDSGDPYTPVWKVSCAEPLVTDAIAKYTLLIAAIATRACDGVLPGHSVRGDGCDADIYAIVRAYLPSVAQATHRHAVAIGPKPTLYQWHPAAWSQPSSGKKQLPACFPPVHENIGSSPSLPLIITPDEVPVHVSPNSAENESSFLVTDILTVRCSLSR
jgi:hypothetical protein